MTAFATASDLAARLNRTFTGAEQDWVTSLLEDAAAIMRGVMRSQVYPSVESEYIAYPVGGRVNLPPFVTAIGSVVQDGAALVLNTDYTRFEDALLLSTGSSLPVTITVTHGLSAAPADLLAINCALVSGAMLTVEAGLGLTAGGLSSVAIDDFKAAFADAGEMSGMALTASNIKYLEDHYGSSAWVVNTR